MLQTATGRPLGEKTVIFRVRNGAGVAVTAASITDPTGAATLDAEVWQGLPAGVYTVEAYFGSVVALDDGATINLLDDRFQASEAAATAPWVRRRPAACGCR
ncbi:MAG: hypothetical protein R2854_26395 [Caldilineaceae bacterium]